MGHDEASDMKALSELVPELGRSYAHMKSPRRVIELLEKMASAGIDSLQVIADFDHTITKQHVDGKTHVSSFCIVNSCSNLPTKFAEKDAEMLKKYLPIERDPHLTKEEKTPHMIEWYTKTAEMLTGCSLDSNDISEAVNKSQTQLRSGLQDLVTSLDSVNVPFLVFSAGLGDVVEAVLKQHGVVNKNIHVIANFLNHKDGLVNGFKNDIVHPFNKNGKAAAHSKYFELMASRHNVILMGDNLGDADMADGVPNTDAVLKIGFLHGDVDRRLPKYLDHFDIVLVDDQTMDVAISVVKHVGVS